MTSAGSDRVHRPSRRGVRTGAIVAYLAAVAGGQMAYQADMIARGTHFQVTVLANDDTFYYLQTAWNVRERGVVSFDGVHATNGVQFLWFWIVAGLASVVASKAALLTAVLVACLVCNAACYVFIGRVGSALGRPWVAAVAAACWAYLNVQHQLLGMENSLHALLFWMTLDATVRAMQANLDPRARRPAGLVAVTLLCLLVWVRVDQALNAIAVGLLLVITVMQRFGRTRAVWRFGVTAAAVAAMGAAVLLGGYHAMGGSFLPVSGLVKQSAYAWSAAHAQILTLRGLEFTLPLVTAWKYVAGEPTLALLWCGWGLCAGLGVAGVATLVRGGGRAAGFGRVFAVFALVTIVHTVYLAGLRDWALYGVWYAGPLFAMWALTLGLAGDEVGRLVARWRPGLGHAAMGAAVALLLLCVFVRHRWVMHDPQNYARPLYAARLEAAAWMAQFLPPEARCAAWNAGQTGYFSARRVTNLDGLANDVTYFRDVMRGGRPVLDYLVAEGIEYVVDYRCPADVRAASTCVRSFPVPDDPRGLVIEVRQLHPLYSRSLAGKN